MGPNGEIYSDCLKYNAKADNWTKSGDLSTGRSSPGVTYNIVFGLVMAGGWNRTKYLETVEYTRNGIYTGKWVALDLIIDTKNEAFGPLDKTTDIVNSCHLHYFRQLLTSAVGLCKQTNLWSLTVTYHLLQSLTFRPWISCLACVHV